MNVLPEHRARRFSNSGVRTRVHLRVLLLVLAVFLAGSVSAEGSDDSLLVTYPTPTNAQTIDRFSVTVNGQPIFVERARRVSFVHFAFAGEAQIEVVFDEDFISNTLSPPRTVNRSGSTCTSLTDEIQARAIERGFLRSRFLGEGFSLFVSLG